jgi:hypothetical protein
MPHALCDYSRAAGLCAQLDNWLGNTRKKARKIARVSFQTSRYSSQQ